MDNLEAQTKTTKGLTSSEKNSENSPETPHGDFRLPRRRKNILIPNAVCEQNFSHQEAMFLFTIVNSKIVARVRERKIYWCTKSELVFEFSEELYKSLKLRGAIEEWEHHEQFTAVTLTPWSASVLGVRIAEYWVRHVKRDHEFRGINRRLKNVRVQRWDTESYWTYAGRPERSVRIPGSTCELPLIGDPEDKSYKETKQEYLEDWQEFTFVKNPRKAIVIKVRVGSFVHEIPIYRDKKRIKASKKKRKTRRRG